MRTHPHMMSNSPMGATFSKGGIGKATAGEHVRKGHITIPPAGALFCQRRQIKSSRLGSSMSGASSVLGGINQADQHTATARERLGNDR